jgi:hypothetical protein
VPALSLVAEGTLGLSVVQVISALEVALGVAVGLASAALVRARTNALGWTLAGLLAGTFATHLAAGYLANLAMAAAFVGAAALLDRPDAKAAVIASFAIAGGGLAHPLFFLLGATILVVAAATAWRAERREAYRLCGAALGAGAVVGAGLLAATVGAAPPDVDTSRDAFLRRAGLTSVLRSLYLDRFVHRWTRYVQWLSLPLGIVGFASPRGTAGRVLRAWFAVTVAGVAIGLATEWLPPDRFMTFGFAIPILAALGLVRLRRHLGARRVLADVVTGLLAVVILAGAGIAWGRQEPFLSREEVTAATVAASLDTRGAPLAFVVDEADRTVSFLATRAGNVIRASVPPERIRDVVVLVPADGVNPERRALEELTAMDLLRAERAAGRPARSLALTPFVDPSDAPANADVVEPDPARAAHASDPLEPASRGAIAWASVATLALLAVAGYGWARIGVEDPITAAAAAPAIGTSALILAGVALDAVGVRLGGTPGAVAASALGAGGGYLVRYVLERRARTRSSPQVE